MKVKQLKKEWKKIIKEVHDKPKCKTPYSQQIVFIRERLLFAEILLGKIEKRENPSLNNSLYRIIMAEYYSQKSLEIRQ